MVKTEKSTVFSKAPKEMVSLNFHRLNPDTILGLSISLYHSAALKLYTGLTTFTMLTMLGITLSPKSPVKPMTQPAPA